MVNSAGMLIGYGVIKGDYLSIPQNFKLNDIRLDNRQLAYKLRGWQILPAMPPRLLPSPTSTCSMSNAELYNVIAASFSA